MKDYLAQCCCHMILTLGNVAAKVPKGIKEWAFLVQLNVRLKRLSQYRLPV